jgi:hypothetical protein
LEFGSLFYSFFFAFFFFFLVLIFFFLFFKRLQYRQILSKVLPDRLQSSLGWTSGEAEVSELQNGLPAEAVPERWDL